MEITFKGMRFSFDIEKPAEGGFIERCDVSPIVEVQIVGERKPIDSRMFNTSEKERLRYVSHSVNERELVVIQRSELVEVRSHFLSYGKSAIRSYTEVKNISGTEIILEHVSSFFCGRIANRYDTENIYLYRFTNGHHVECQPKKASLSSFGLFQMIGGLSKKHVFGFNSGSQSTKEELPQFILQDNVKGKVYFAAIESCCDWFWDIGEYDEYIYVNLGGGNLLHNGWYKTLRKGEKYSSPFVCVVAADTIPDAINEMTQYRRQIVKERPADENLPTVFNEYMHLSWDSPNEERTAVVAPEVAKLGVDYYVIDCGWHNEEPSDIIYSYVGQWRGSTVRYPKGIKHTIDYIHSLGMKAGLWLEPETVGRLCEEMIEYYPDDAWLKRLGKPIIARHRRLLDFRNKVVLDYLNSVMDTLLGEYGVDYLKFDYNQDSGSFLDGGDTLEQNGKAFLAWVDSIMEKYPNVIIEECSSGGMRMEYETLSHYSITSTSDQANHREYPYLIGNFFAAVLPEQAAVWSYPVDTWVGNIPDDEEVAMNMINTFLGRMHLASDITKLSETQKDLVREGIKYYHSLTDMKKKALPFMPLGFTDFSQKLIACGLETEEKIYLAVWNLDDKPKTVEIPIMKDVENVAIGYPKNLPSNFSFDKGNLTVCFSAPFSARFFEIVLKR